MKKSSVIYILIISIASVMVLTTCAKKETPKPSEPENPVKADSAAGEDQVKHKVLSFNLEGLSDKGTKKWDVKGESAEAMSETQVQLNNIVAKSYGEESEATITADHGIYDKAQNNVCLDTNVKATIENTQGGGGDFIDFSGQMASQGAKKDQSKPDKNTKKRTVITCDGDVKFEYEKNRAYFNKNVKVATDDGDIEADKITLNLDEVTRKVKEIIAEGNVKITKGENITYSDTATYVEADKKVILTGRPKIVIYQDGSIAGGFLGEGTNASSGNDGIGKGVRR